MHCVRYSKGFLLHSAGLLLGGKAPTINNQAQIESPLGVLNHLCNANAFTFHSSNILKSTAAESHTHAEGKSPYLESIIAARGKIRPVLTEAERLRVGIRFSCL